MAFEISPEVGLRFGDLTPDEFGQIVQGYRQREDRDWYRIAWMVSYLLKPHVSRQKQRTLTPEKLLGRRIGKRPKPVTPTTEETN